MRKSAAKARHAAVFALCAPFALSSCDVLSALFGGNDAAPTPGSGGIEVLSVSRSIVELRWPRATDDKTAASDLSYLVAASSQKSALETASSAEAAAVSAWNPDMLYFAAPAESDAETWFAVLVRDEKGNISLYPPVKAATPPYHGRLSSAYGTDGHEYLHDPSVDLSLYDMLPRPNGGSAVLGTRAQSHLLCALLDSTGSLAKKSQVSPVNNLMNAYCLLSAEGVTLSDGSIVAMSRARLVDSTGQYGSQDAEALMYVKFDAEGALVAGFGIGGPTANVADGVSLLCEANTKAYRNVPGGILAVKDGASEWVYISGYSSDSSARRYPEDDIVDWDLIRLSALDGSLDAGFGTGGFKATGIKGKTLALQGSDMLVVGGQSWADNRTVVGRFDLDGNVDPGFGSSGLGDLGDLELAAISLDSQGNIYAAGSIAGDDGRRRPAVVKLDRNGNVAAGFGSGGAATLGLWRIAGSERGGVARAIIADPDGAIIVTGERTGMADSTAAREQPYEMQDVFVAKLDPSSGALFAEGELEFGEDGILYPKIGMEPGRTDPSGAASVFVREDGDILVGGNQRFYYDAAGRQYIFTMLVKP